MTCKDCLYYEPCSTLNAEFKKHPKDFIDSDLCAKQCTTFKDRSRFVELPCPPGDLVFFIHAHRVMAEIVSKFVIEKGRIKLQRINGHDLGYADQIGERLFLTCEEAEQALKERNNA